MGDTSLTQAAELEDEPADLGSLVADPDRARQYVQLLATAGIERGLIGPREGKRLWTRHFVNCAALGRVLPELLEDGGKAHLIDVGSGAGLPGIPLALAAGELQVTLVEPLLRRAKFLTEAVDLLRLDARVQVVRARAEDLAQKLSGEVVTARAVAPLERLVDWCLPLVSRGGVLLALKGDSGAAELAGANLKSRNASGKFRQVESLPGYPPTQFAEIRWDKRRQL